MTVAAFHTWLNEQLYELKELLENDTVIYSHGYSPSELQKLLSKHELPDDLNKSEISAQLIRILDIAAEGLKQRNIGEEVLLRPLYERAERSTNPARVMVSGLAEGVPIRHFIEQYAAI